jgi:osmoprotectant transport system permease protein
VAGAPAGKEQSEDEDEERQIIRVGAKTFTEQYILSNAIVKRLEDSGIRAETTGSLGSTVIFEALTNGDIDLFVGYSGTIWANAMNRSEMAQSWRVLQATKGWLASEHGVRTVGTLGFENTYMLAMRRGRADEMGIDTLVDLSEHAPSMQMGGDYEYFGRPEWDKVRETYGLRFSSKTTYDSSLMYRALKTEEVDVIAAFSSDGRIRAYDLKLLEDPRGAIPPYHAMLLLGPTIADREDVVKALRPMVGAIPVERMQRANYMVDRDEDKKTVPEAAEWLNEQIDQQ